MINYVIGPFESEVIQFKQSTKVGMGYTSIEFGQEIYWTTQSESIIEFRHGGRVVDTRSTFNDYYGFMTSIKHAVEEAKYLAKLYEVTEDSSMVISVRTTVKKVPYVRTPRCEQTDLSDVVIRHPMESVPSEWKLQNDLPLEPQIISEEITWSSKK